MMDYYNDNDPHAVEWLRQLVRDGLIPFGDVDDRSIADVSAGDLEGYRRVHFFAGIGGWAYALELAKWPEDRPVWTGSCPCQPFSAAGKRKGTEDERHLWPEFARLIGERFPPTVFGEQVASKAGREWLAGVRADLEALGYAVGAADLCAAGAGAPHIRQRLWWVADAVSAGRAERGAFPGDGSLAGMRGASGVGDPHGERAGRNTGAASGAQREGQGERFTDGDQGRDADRQLSGVADADGGEPRHGGLQLGGEHGQQPQDGGAGALADTGDRQFSQPFGRSKGRDGYGSACPDDPRSAGRPGPVNGLWRDADWLFCRDGKWRPVEPGTFPLGHGVSGRVGLLRGYGNAIVPQVAAAFIEAYLEAKGGMT